MQCTLCIYTHSSLSPTLSWLPHHSGLLRSSQKACEGRARYIQRPSLSDTMTVSSNKAPSPNSPFSYEFIGGLVHWSLWSNHLLVVPLTRARAFNTGAFGHILYLSHNSICLTRFFGLELTCDSYIVVSVMCMLFATRQNLFLFLGPREAVTDADKMRQDTGIRWTLPFTFRSGKDLCWYCV